MKTFIVENGINGILSALFISFSEKIFPDSVEDEKLYQPRLDGVNIKIATNIQNAERVKKALFKYGGDDIIAHLRVCLSSCDSRALTYAFNYGYLTLKQRTDVSKNLSEKFVSDFSYIVQKVLHERHILTGMLRFAESSSGVLYARYSPDNDVTSILAPHFLKRLGHTPFIIHDVKRGKIAISNGRAIKIDFTDLPPTFTPSENEEKLKALWRKYYNKINIEERKNPRQQDGYFPRRYRQYCFETYEC